MSMTRGAMVLMAFWRAAICFLMLSSSWCSLFWEQPPDVHFVHHHQHRHRLLIRGSPSLARQRWL